MSKKFEVLIRSLVANMLPDRDYDLHDLWINEGGESYKRIVLNASDGGWSVDLAA